MSNQNLRSNITATDALSKSWNSIKPNIWTFIGFTVVYLIAIGMIQKISFVGQFTSLISFIYTVSIYSALQMTDWTGGASFNDFFSWAAKFGKLFGSNIILLLLGVVIFLPVIFLLIAIISSASILAIFTDPMHFIQQFVGISAGAILLLILLCVIVGVLFLMLNFAFMFLILFKDISIGDALKLSWAVGVKNFGQLILYCLLGACVMLLGLLALVVGLLVAWPVVVGMQYYFLKSIFPDHKEEEWDFMKEAAPTDL